MSLAQLKIDIKAVFNDLTGKTANVKGDEIATAIWNNGSGISNYTKECGDADYTILDDDGYNTFIFRELTADRALNLPTLSANQGREITAIVDNVNLWILTLEHAPATDWAVGDIITGQTNLATSTAVRKISALQYIVKDYLNPSGNGYGDEVIGVTGVAEKLADQAGHWLVIVSCSTYKVTITHETTDPINGFHPGDIHLNMPNGWWKLTGMASEWKAITDGYSTIYQTIGPGGDVLTVTSGVWQDVGYYVISNLPKGVYEIEACGGLWYWCYGISLDGQISLGIGTVTGDVAPDIAVDVVKIAGIANHLTQIIGTFHPIAHHYINNDSTIDIYMKAQNISNETVAIFNTVTGLEQHAGWEDYTNNTWIRARRIF